MSVTIVERDRDYILGHCTKYLARDWSLPPRHGHGSLPATDPRASVCEAWRFPVIDRYSGPPPSDGDAYHLNDVTFVYFDPRATAAPARVELIGTFANLYEPIPLVRIDDLPYWALTVAVATGELHVYRYLVDGQPALDPINPQRSRLDNGVDWSRFFTDGCVVPVSFERWERDILDRLTSHILPFHTAGAQRFLERYYDTLDRQSRQRRVANAYRLDAAVGAANYIDKLLAREESHHLDDYKICLELIDGVLRQRNPFVDPAAMPVDMYVQLYDEMATGSDGSVPGWDTGRYARPRYFLELLRRHTLTGAFAHPKYGGNSGAAGWAYLEDRYRDPADPAHTLFDWRTNQEPPLGHSSEYRG